VAAGPVGTIHLAALAGVLFMTAIRVERVATVRSIMTSTRSDASIFTVNALVTGSFDLIVAVLNWLGRVGVVALRGAARTTGVSLEPIRAEEPSELDDSIVAIRFQGPLFFVSAERVLETVRGVRGASVVILRLSRLERVDATGAQV